MAELDGQMEFRDVCDMEVIHRVPWFRTFALCEVCRLRSPMRVVTDSLGDTRRECAACSAHQMGLL